MTKILFTFQNSDMLEQIEEIEIGDVTAEEEIEEIGRNFAYDNHILYIKHEAVKVEAAKRRNKA